MPVLHERRHLQIGYAEAKNLFDGYIACREMIGILKLDRLIAYSKIDRPLDVMSTEKGAFSKRLVVLPTDEGFLGFGDVESVPILNGLEWVS